MLHGRYIHFVLLDLLTYTFVRDLSHEPQLCYMIVKAVFFSTTKHFSLIYLALLIKGQGLSLLGNAEAGD